MRRFEFEAESERDRPTTSALRRRIARAPLLLWIAVAGCGGAGASGTDHVDAMPRLTIEEELRIGDRDDPSVGFSRVYGADVDGDGNLYALETSVPEIRVFGPDGEFLRRIGGSGGGPGEFEGAPRFGVVGDTVWAIDNRANRITLFDREGNLLSTGRVESATVALPGTTIAHMLPWAMRPDGMFTSHLARISGNPNAPESGVRPTDSIPVPLVLFDATGAVADTIGWAPRPPPRMWRPPSEAPAPYRSIEIDGRRRSVPRPPTTLPYWMAVPDGYVMIETPLAETADDAVFTVTRTGLSGDTIVHRELRYAPAPYTSADLDSIAIRAARGGPGGGVPFSPTGGPGLSEAEARNVARALRREMDYPEFQLPLASYFLGKDESIWLRLNEEAEDGAARWIVLEADGRTRGEIILPPDARPAWASGDTLWLVDPDELEVPWLVRFRLAPGS